MLLGLALINPNGWVAEQNLARYADTGRLDVDYLAGLSADAAPTLVELPADLRRCVLEPVAPDGFLGWNYGRAAARAATTDLDDLGNRPWSCPGEVGD